MVVFTLTAQVLDMLLVKTTAFTIDTTLSIIGWGGKKVLNMLFWNNHILTEEEQLKQQIQLLTQEVKLLKETTESYKEPYLLVEKNNI